MSESDHSTRAGARTPAVASRCPTWVTLGAVVAIFSVVRMAGLRGDLWLDEIWSLQMVAGLGSALEILTRMPHDNNHPLNSFWLYLLQPTAAEWTYRLLAWGTGTAAVALAGLVARQQFRRIHPEASAAQIDAAGLLTAVVFGASYLMIHYASEARGYAPAVGFGLLALYALQQPARTPWSVWTPVYWLACVLGVLSHLTLVPLMAAGLVWCTIREPERTSRTRTRLLRVACWHLPPWLFVAALYLGFVRRMEIGGGPEYALVPVLGETAAHAFGLPVAAGVAVALPVAIAVSIGALDRIWRGGDRALAVFYALAIVVAPGLAIGLGTSALLFPRYFALPVALTLLLFGHLLAWFWMRDRGWRAVVLLVVALFVAGNAVPVAKLFRDGRGQYRAALRHVAEATATPVITVSSDHDFRNATVIDHHRSALPPERELLYRPAHRLPAEGVQWIFLHRLDGEEPPGERIQDARKNAYQLDAVAPHAALSGWHWFLYRREDSAASP